MYVPLTVLLTIAGVQVPVMPLSEVAGNTGANCNRNKLVQWQQSLELQFGFTVTLM